MKKISAIGFDWGGVILQNIDGGFNDAAANFLQIDKERFRHAYFLHNHIINKQTDNKDTERWSNILSELGLIDRLDVFMEFVQNRPKGEVSQAMVHLLQQLKNNGWKLGLLSNTSLEGAQCIKAEECVKLFDATLYSAEINCMKPEPEAFIALASALAVPMSELVFIDDSERSLSTAPQLGYIPLLFSNTNTLIDQLKNLGITY